MTQQDHGQARYTLSECDASIDLGTDFLDECGGDGLAIEESSGHGADCIWLKRVILLECPAVPHCFSRYSRVYFRPFGV